MSRNEAEDIQWTLNLDEFENYCRTSNINPATLLQPNSVEVRVKRGKKYLCGGKLLYRGIRVSPDSRFIELRAQGFLNLFKKRFTAAERIFSATQGPLIAWGLIDESQSQGPNWDFGVTQGAMASPGVHDRTYHDDEIKDSIQNLTKVQVAPFDFEFTHDKVFNTYLAIGSQRPEMVFEYPGNIKKFDLPLDGTLTANSIRVLGSGSGTDGSVRVVRDDLNSQANYGVLEEKLLDSSVTETDTLNEHGDAELAAVANPFEIPTIEVDGNVAPFLTDYTIGDYVKVIIRQYGLASNINAMYRIEKIDLSIDENDNESVKLYLSR